jgi:hypothetical protein
MVKGLESGEAGERLGLVQMGSTYAIGMGYMVA